MTAVHNETSAYGVLSLCAIYKKNVVCLCNTDCDLLMTETCDSMVFPNFRKYKCIILCKLTLSSAGGTVCAKLEARIYKFCMPGRCLQHVVFRDAL